MTSKKQDNVTKISKDDQRLLTFPIDIKNVLKQLNQDMRDDWFADALSYTDIFSSSQDVCKTITDLLHEGHGLYPSGGRRICDIPKVGMGLRYAIETDFYDRFIYQAICSYLIPFYDKRLSNRVLGHRFDPYAQKKKYLFKHRIELWRTFEGITHVGLKDSGFLLVTDISNYFENISVEHVIQSLYVELPLLNIDGLEKQSIQNAITTLKMLLEKWCFKQSHGLPQNRDTSSFLANMVLNQVDKSMVKRGYDYYRYVDDIRIVCTSDTQARIALGDLISELRQVGLNINSSKTDILTAASSSEQIAKHFPSNDDRVVTIDNMWRSKSLRVITRSIPYIQELLRDLVQTGDSQSRQFRFCVNRLKTLADADVFDIGEILTPEISKALLILINEQPASTDYFCKIASCVPNANSLLTETEGYLLDDRRAIYSWQNYNLWLLFTSKGYITDELVKCALNRIQSDITSPEIPAIFIYLGKSGRSDLLEPYIDSFDRNWSYQHQRSFLIATQDMQENVLRRLLPKIGYRLNGTVRRIKENKALTDKYYYRAPIGDITEIFDQISPYD